MIRPILSLKRLSFDKTQGQVIYQYGKDSEKTERMDYLEFIVRVTSHIPDKGQVTLRYYGLYSNAHRGKMRKAGVDPSHPPIINDEVSFVPSNGWAEMIRKLQSFAFRASIGWEIFLLSASLALVISLLAVSYQSIRAALANPVDSLRYE